MKNFLQILRHKKDWELADLVDAPKEMMMKLLIANIVRPIE